MATASVNAPSTEPHGRWRDRKLLLWPLALIVPAIPLRTIAVADDAPAIAWFLAPVVVFLLFPIIDTVVGLDRRNPPDSEVARLESRSYYRWVTYAYIPLQYASLVVACSLWASGELAWWQSLGLATSVGCAVLSARAALVQSSPLA